MFEAWFYVNQKTQQLYGIKVIKKKVTDDFIVNISAKNNKKSQKNLFCTKNKGLSLKNPALFQMNLTKHIPN